MIRLTRNSPEPAGLTIARGVEMPKAREAMLMRGGKGHDGKAFKFANYDAGKEVLFRSQYQKCAYCEKREEQAKFRDVDHFRPKAIYWWLAWSWDNQLFSCVDCNREHKRDQFPLRDGAPRLDVDEAPPGREQPLVLDPFDPGFDPSRHIEFRRERFQAKERWTPYGVSPEGVETIRVCGLDRPGLLDLYRRHVNDFVRPKVDTFHMAAQANDARNTVAAWSSLRRCVLAPGQAFCALSRDAVRVLTSNELRAQFQLTV